MIYIYTIRKKITQMIGKLAIENIYHLNVKLDR